MKQRGKGKADTAMKGFIIGGSMLVPGVSGGTMAMILGIYESLLSAVGSFRKNIGENISFLCLFCLGALCGAVLLARPLLFLVESYPFPMLYFFMGAVAGGVPLMLKKARCTGFRWRYVLCLLLGAAIVFALSFLPENGVQPQASPWLTAALLLGGGALCAAALILPGISFSYMLLVLGLYDRLIAAVQGLDFVVLAPFGIGLLLGIFLLTKALEHAMQRHPGATYFIILGFLLSSVAEIFPGIPTGWNLLLCPLLFLGGAVLFWRLSLVLKE